MTSRPETLISPITDVIAELRAGRMVVLVDEEDRENEGDLLIAAEFAVNLIPHTLSATNLGAARTGDRVNLEVDMLARYVERLQEFR